jgi:alkylmercury lyase
MTDTVGHPSAAEVIDDIRHSGALDFGRDVSLVALRLLELLSGGRPVPRAEIDAVLDGLDVDQERVRAFLDAATERGTNGDIVGFGLTCTPTAHQVTIDSARLGTWCAMDTMIFAAALGRTLQVESTAPGTGQTVRLQAHPHGPDHIDPPTAVITWPRRQSKDEVDLSSAAGILATLCNHSLFLPTREQAEQWADGRDDIAILPVQDGFAIARTIADGFLRYQKESG